MKLFIKAYDKDNDVYEDIVTMEPNEESITPEEAFADAKRVAEAISKKVKSEEIVRTCSDGHKEPFDLVVIEDETGKELWNDYERENARD